MAQTQTIGTHKTQVHMSNNENGSALEVYYHNTRVVFYCNGHIKLDTGGWSTVTTKLRMNQASNQYNLGYKVFQKIMTGLLNLKARQSRLMEIP